MAAPVFAEYPYNTPSYGMNAEAWLLMAIFGIIWLIVVSFVFSWIFWKVAFRIFNKYFNDWKNWKMNNATQIKTEEQKPQP